MGVEIPADIELDVSRETRERLSIYVDTLLRWNQKINLIGRTTMSEVWRRHIMDSAQLSHLAHNATSWVDLGSGAGLPALVIAAMRMDQEHAFSMTVIESDQRKCAFIAEAARKMCVPVNVVNSRIETAPPYGYDVISARALAPLAKLLGYAARFRTSETICLFPKGARVDLELTEAAEAWHMTYERHRSAVDEASVILEMKEFERVA